MISFLEEGLSSTRIFVAVLYYYDISVYPELAPFNSQSSN